MDQTEKRKNLEALSGPMVLNPHMFYYMGNEAVKSKAYIDVASKVHIMKVLVL